MSLILQDRRLWNSSQWRRQKDYVRRLYDDAFAAGCTIPELFARRRRATMGWFNAERLCLTTTTDKIAYGTYVAMTVTNLQSLLADVTDPFASWQSARVSNWSTLADDYEIGVSLPATAHAPAGNAAAYCYLVPWMSTDAGTTWLTKGNFGTTTLPTGSEGTASVSDPNNMKGPVILAYKVTSQIMQVGFTIGGMSYGIVPDGWSLAIRTENCAVGANQGLTTGCVVDYTPVTYTNS